MMGLETIRKISRDLAKNARQRGSEPLVFFNAAAVEKLGARREDGGFSIPSFGDYTPKGWKRVLWVGNIEFPLFCDMSGSDDEGPALNDRKMKDRLKLMVEQAEQDTKHTYGIALIEHGQFQCYVGAFRKMVYPGAKAKAA